MGDSVSAAVRELTAGRLVVYPTDTLLGLGACATDSEAVERLIAAKGRPPGRALSVALSSTEELESFADLSAAGRRFVRRNLPGAYTVLLRPSPLARRTFAAEVAGSHSAIGVRVPDHPLARELARRAGPLVATSANRHGSPPCETMADARRAFGTSVAVYLEGPPRPSGRPSELVDLTGASPHPVPRK